MPSERSWGRLSQAEGQCSDGRRSPIGCVACHTSPPLPSFSRHRLMNGEERIDTDWAPLVMAIAAGQPNPTPGRKVSLGLGPDRFDNPGPWELRYKNVLGKKLLHVLLTDLLDIRRSSICGSGLKCYDVVPPKTYTSGGLTLPAAMPTEVKDLFQQQYADMERLMGELRVPLPPPNRSVHSVRLPHNGGCYKKTPTKTHTCL